MVPSVETSVENELTFHHELLFHPTPTYVAVDQLGEPVHIVKIMTFPEKVNQYNLDKLRQRVRSGSDIHAGANQIRLASMNTKDTSGASGTNDSFVKSLAFGDRDCAPDQLRIGDIIERHMENRDILLFISQPTLHKLSIMSHKVKVMEWRTFRFNICVCAPYNAGFDGDEMNMHLPQTQEARTEATLFMGVHNNLTIHLGTGNL